MALGSDVFFRAYVLFDHLSRRASQISPGVFDGKNALPSFINLKQRPFFFCLLHHYSALLLIRNGEPRVAWKTYCAGLRFPKIKWDQAAKVKGTLKHVEWFCLLLRNLRRSCLNLNFFFLMYSVTTYFWAIYQHCWILFCSAAVSHSVILL